MSSEPTLESKSGTPNPEQKSAIASIIGTLKPYLRWVILGLTFFFIAATLRQHWQDVLALRLREGGLRSLVAGFGVTLIAHVWSGAVWGGLLQICGQGQPARWAIATYLRTNLAKYLPGNIWHFYSRLQASRAVGIPTDPALLSIVLEPLLMAAAALFLACLTYRFSPWQDLVLIAILVGIHPRFLNPVLRKTASGKVKALRRRGAAMLKSQPTAESAAGEEEAHPDELQLQGYPLFPLLGELLFVALRGAGFLLAVQALSALQVETLPILVSAFSLAWVMGLVIPGAPGGIGVFEAVAIALLQGQLPAEQVLGAVACYRLISTLAEVAGAGLAPLFWRGSKGQGSKARGNKTQIQQPWGPAPNPPLKEDEAPPP